VLTFVPIIPTYCGPGLPQCPDGSGDLWWDDASYIRYQTFEPEYRPEHIAYQTDSLNYCDGPPVTEIHPWFPGEPPF
jgi:hypothetical protein